VGSPRTTEPLDGALAAAGGGVAVLAVAGALVPVQDRIDPANVALVLMLVVVGAAAVGGRLAGMVTATVAALAFNFFHTEPYLTLQISDGRNVLAFLLLLVGGLAVGQLAHVAAERGREAARRATGIDQLHELASLAAADASAELLLDRSRAYLVDELGLASCEFEWGDEPSAPPDLDHGGVIDGPLRHGVGGFELPRGGVSLPVIDERRTVVGRFVLRPSEGRGVSLVDRKLAVLVADLVAPALSHRAPGST
jgi:hypothetical protein